MIITLISDSHNKHNEITQDLPGGEILIHAGDLSSLGSKLEIESFVKWFDSIDNYTHKVFIAGNHDWGFQMATQQANEIVNSYKTIDYLQDEQLTLYYDGPNGEFLKDNIRIWGSPWQPEFYDWAFNLPRNGEELKAKWDEIPMNTDILITHGPPFGRLDMVKTGGKSLGCELLAERVQVVKPKIHVFGHIHGGYGHSFNGDTHFFNASVLNDNYNYANKPITIDWDQKINEIKFLNS
jgi:3',5'-cyclic AMP phosphodiesterase CpdA